MSQADSWLLVVHGGQDVWHGVAALVSLFVLRFSFFPTLSPHRHTSTAAQSGPLGLCKEDGRHSTAGFETIASERNTRHSAATAVSGASWDEPAVGLDLGAIRKLATLGQNFWEDIHAPGKVSPLDMLKIRPTPVMK